MANYIIEGGKRPEGEVKISGSKNASLPIICASILRGSYATKWLRNGVEIKGIADILEHKRIETTENYYISSTIEDRQKASAVLENIIQSDITNKIINFEEFVKKVE